MFPVSNSVLAFTLTAAVLFSSADAATYTAGVDCGSYNTAVDISNSDTWRCCSSTRAKGVEYWIDPATTADWWRGRPSKNYFFSFPYQNDETPLFYLRKLRVPLALRGSQNPKVEGPLARCPSFPVRKSRRSSDTSQLPRKKFTTPSDPIVDQTTSPTPDDAGALIFQNLRRGSGRVGENTKRHYLIIFQCRDPSLQRIISRLEFLYRLDSDSE